MADNKEKFSIVGWWEGLKAEFGKIFWPDANKTAKQSTAVVVASVIIALLIVFFDMIIKYGVDFLVNQ